MIEIFGQTYTKQELVLDGCSYRGCTFDECVLIYRGGPAQVATCYISPGCKWQFEDAAYNVWQILLQTGWKMIPPGDAVQIQ